jgi:hypothetical protein
VSFIEKADSAAERLKADMGLEPTKVQVNADGRQVQPPPPGSYAAMALERQRAQAEAERAAVQNGQQVEPSVPVAEPDHSQAPSPEEPQQQKGQPTPQPEYSPRANERIAELANARREAERKQQEAEAKAAANERELEQLRKDRQRLEAERNRILQDQLETMDPETRTRVLAEGRTRELLAETEDRIMSRIEKPVAELRAASREAELSRVAQKYPGFDYETHRPLIDMFQKQNPASTVEQAFRAVAEDNELGTRPVQRGRQVPPVPTPRTTRGSQDYVPNEQPKKSEDQVLAEEVEEIRKLGSSSDPVDKRRHRDLLDAHLSKRFAQRFPARK